MAERSLETSYGIRRIRPWRRVAAALAAVERAASGWESPAWQIH